VGAADREPPDWALQAARAELHDVPEDSEHVRARAREIAKERKALQRERHDEYDDPDSGGEG
jgi:hypothetical protein